MYSISPKIIDAEIVKSKTSALLKTCGVEARLIFLEAPYYGYTGTTKGAHRTILNEALKKVSDFKQDVLLAVYEKSKHYGITRYGGRMLYSVIYEASLIDPDMKTSHWFAKIDLNPGSEFRSDLDKERADALSRGVLARLIDDGIIRDCPEATVRALKAPIK